MKMSIMQKNMKEALEYLWYLSFNLNNIMLILKVNHHMYIY